jgi:DNA modification methylase
MSNLPGYQILHADAFEWLSEREVKSIHAVVTDPPYGILEYLPEQIKKRRSHKGGIWRLPQSYDGCKRSPIPRFTVLRSADLARLREFHRRLSEQLYRVLVPGGHVILASQNLLSHWVICAFVDSEFEIRGQIARIVKTLRGGDRPKGAHKEYPDVSVNPRSCWEPWLIFRKPCDGRVRDNLKKWGTGALRRPTTNIPFTDLIQSSPAKGVEKEIAPHPSLKPQDFIRKIVWTVLPLGKGIILDPFMGSGSTIAAAQHFKLESIGLEVDQEYFYLAQQAVPQLAAIKTGSSMGPGFGYLNR